MDLDAGALHSLAATVAVLLGVTGPVVAIVYAVRVDHRDVWRRPMVVTGMLAAAAVLAVYLSGRWLVGQDPGLRRDPVVAPHLEYADRLLIPGAGFFVVVLLCGLVNPRTGALRTLLPMLLSAFAVIVLGLVVLSSDPDARLLLDKLADAF